MKGFCFLLILIAYASSNQFLAFYPYDILTTAQYRCVKDQGFNRISIWVQSAPKGVQQESVQNVLNANNAGLQVEIYMTPCRARTIATQSQLIIKHLGTLFQTIWVYPEAADQECSWYEYPEDMNCVYLVQFINQMKKNSKKVGIVGNRKYWAKVFAGAQGCPEVSMLDLLWVPSDIEIDRQKNFNSYRKIGGWEKPSAKLYDSKYLCGETMSLVYSP